MTNKEVQISVVVPVYNEDKNIEPLYMELKPVLHGLTSGYEIIFVDDGSTDKSFEILSKLQQSDAKIVVVRFRKNFGQTAAIAAGFDKMTQKIFQN